MTDKTPSAGITRVLPEIPQEVRAVIDRAYGLCMILEAANCFIGKDGTDAETLVDLLNPAVDLAHRLRKDLGRVL